MAEGQSLLSQPQRQTWLREPRRKPRQNILGMECIGGDLGVHGGSGTAEVNPCGSTAWARALPRGKGAESCGHSLRKLVS